MARHLGKRFPEVKLLLPFNNIDVDAYRWLLIRFPDFHFYKREPEVRVLLWWGRAILHR